MKSNSPKRPDEYRYLKTKLLRRAALTVAAVTAAMFLLYLSIINSLAGTGVISTVMIRFLTLLLGSYASAFKFYQSVFREYRGLTFLVGVILIALVALSLYVRGFVRYFKDISRGIDVLLRDDESEAQLLPELEAVERKINSAKRALRDQKRKLAEAEQRKNDLIMYLAHDLKTPLASVIGYLELLRDEQRISPELREHYLSITLDKAQRLEDLINEFFEITRFNLSHIELQMKQIDLSRLLQQLVYEFGPLLREKGFSCALHLPEDLPLRCDADKLQRVFDNLLRNAVLYGAGGTEISVSARSDAGTVTVEVSNFGDDIPPEKLSRLFEQFYRLDSARSSRTGGAGLGLAIARQIVELHGGSIKAQSRDGMTTFTVTLPASLENR